MSENQIRRTPEDRIERLKSRLKFIAHIDAVEVFNKDVNYGHSWKKRGGVGAFMVIARKWDRLEERLQKIDASFSGDGASPPPQYDLFHHIEADPRDEGVIDDIRDLRRYLLLVEEEMVERGVLPEVLGTNSFEAMVETRPGRKTTEHPAPFGFDPDQDLPPGEQDVQGKK